jgi:hypothetical protein
LSPILPLDATRLTTLNHYTCGSKGARAMSAAKVCSQTYSAKRSSEAATEIWSMSPDQAAKFVEAVAEVGAAMQGLMVRLRISLGYEDGILRGDRDADTLIRNANQIKLE